MIALALASEARALDVPPDDGMTWFSQPETARFFDNLNLGLKFHVLDQAPRVPSFSLSATASVPTGGGEGYSGLTDAFLVAYLSKDVGPLHLDLNASLDLWRLEGAVLPQAWSALAFSVGLPAHFGVMLEPHGFSDASPIAPSDVGLLAAINYQPLNWLVVDAGVEGGLLESRGTASAFAGVTIMPADLWDTAAKRRVRAERLARPQL